MSIIAQFSKFAVAGGLAAAANFSSRFLFSLFFPYIAAITLAFIVGLVTGFLLMKRYVFKKGSQHTAKQMLIYTLVNIAGLALTIAVSLSVSEFIQNATSFSPPLAEAVGHFFGVGSPIMLSFFAHKKFTFA